jgi:hypothetical protein
MWASIDFDWLDKLERDGFAIVDGVLDEACVDRLIRTFAVEPADESVRQRKQQTYAIRNALSLLPEVRRVAQSTPVRNLVDAAMRPAARPVRGILFDRTPDANWKVAWHQDLSIAVKRRIEVPGFGPWSQKAGVPHVQPPDEVLQHMLTVRLHLDDCGPENGPLKVIPGSHRFGVLSREQVKEQTEEAVAHSCCVRRGGAVLMRPLILHASWSAAGSGHRRVVHLEYSASTLPHGLEWWEET